MHELRNKGRLSEEMNMDDKIVVVLERQGELPERHEFPAALYGPAGLGPSAWSPQTLITQLAGVVQKLIEPLVQVTASRVDASTHRLVLEVLGNRATVMIPKLLDATVAGAVAAINRTPAAETKGPQLDPRARALLERAGQPVT
jgi:hypothetical protein